MKPDAFERIIRFLLGASFGIVLFGAISIFFIFFSFGLSIAFLATLFFIIVSLFLVLLLDAFLVNKERLKEMQKQTKLLEEIHHSTVK